MRSLTVCMLDVVTHLLQTGYIVSNADDLLGLFDADFGILVIGEGAKILGADQHGQEILIMAEYLRLKQFKYVFLLIELAYPYLPVPRTIQASQAVVRDFPDLELSAGSTHFLLAHDLASQFHTHS